MHPVDKSNILRLINRTIDSLKLGVLNSHNYSHEFYDLCVLDIYLVNGSCSVAEYEQRMYNKILRLREVIAINKDVLITVQKPNNSLRVLFIQFM